MLSERMRHLTPYTAGEQPRDRSYIKLNTNENPYPPTGKVARFLKRIDPDMLRLYPDPNMTRLRQVIAEREGLAPENVFAGNGSDEVLSFCFYAFFDSVRFPQLTYSFYPVYCDFYGISKTTVPMKPDLGIDLEAMVSRERQDPVIVANPNSPTGMYLEKAEIEKFLHRYNQESIVIVDEAYIDFGGETCAGLINTHKNLVVVRTLSKSHSLAGARLGYALAGKPLIDALFVVKDSFNSYPVDTLAQEIGVRALTDCAPNRRNIEKIIATREWTAGKLAEMGWSVKPSRSNFLFCSMPGRDGFFVYSELKKRGILVRYFDKDRLRDSVRISIGTRKQMQSLLTAVQVIAREPT
ncbi:MAG: histidinol-phosphate transaminase [Spirochaetales bacterium]|nr:histidinol-phosphate transaminase [Spirochaetales bacterium]